MLAQRSPREAYRRVAFDAAVGVADARHLVALCYEQLIGALGTAIHAHRADDNRLKSHSLTRALAAITALQMGISGNADMAAALRQLYGAARRTILDSVPAFEPDRLAVLRQDFVEIAATLAAARPDHPIAADPDPNDANPIRNGSSSSVTLGA